MESDYHNDLLAYTQLSLPGAQSWRTAIRDFLLTGFVRSTTSRCLAAQMRLRTQPPDRSCWPDAKHQELACALAEIICEEIGWPNSHFIPQDPMRLVLYKLDSEGLFWDYMELEGIFYRINELIARKRSSEDFNQIFDMNFGEAVDYLLSEKNQMTD